jgi:1-acyl-sn-glycerol-3-phosphate acyltransferase
MTERRAGVLPDGPDDADGPGAARGEDQAPDARRVLAEVDAVRGELGLGMARRARLTSELTAELGLDSLAVVELHDRIERAFGVHLPDEVLASADTPADWLGAVRRALGSGAASAPGAPAPTAAGRAPSSLARVAGAPWPEGAGTLLGALAWHVERHPELVCVRLRGAAAGPAAGAGATATATAVAELTYGELAAEATDVARALLAEGVGRGERIGVMLPTGRSYFAVFLGALLAGGVPVPVYPPAHRSALEAHLVRQARLLDNAGVSVLVTDPEARAAAALLRPHVPSLRGVRTPEALGDGWRHDEVLPVVGPDDLALVQYTSGSTGNPKGVTLTHRQLLANVAAMGRVAEVGSSDVFVSWLPLYHDMGLIGAWHAPLVFGIPLVVLSPLTFLAHPVAWLDAVTEEGGTISAAPNFAFQSCTERVTDDELERLDLSSWRVVFNGSEPVSAQVVDAFATRFGPHGFRREAMCPAYGLAELGVGVSFTPLSRGPRFDTVSRSNLARVGRAVPVPPGSPDGRTTVSCGVPLPGYEVKVAGPRGDELPDRREGVVFCRGPSATTGYFANVAATRTLWSRGWLRTGDLGYIAEGELFLTGREKDLVIRAGRNLHPEDLESALGELDGVRPGGVAVFAAADPHFGTERLTVAVETDAAGGADTAGWDDLVGRVRAASVDLLGTPPDDVVLVPAGSLLRTPSGKLRRSAIRQAYEEGQLGKRPPPVALQLVRFAASGARPAGRRLARAIETSAFGATCWVAVMAVGVPLWLAVLLPIPRRARWSLARGAARTLSAVTGTAVAVQGKLPEHGQAVVVANHASFLDGMLLLLASPRPITFVTSTELGRHAVVGPFLRRLGCVVVARGRAGRSAGTVEELTAAAAAGLLAVFPEGSITRVPGLRPFHLGAFAAAVGAGCPVVPVGIRGSRNVLRPGTTLAHRGAVAVVVGDPVAPTGDGLRAQVALRDAARRTVAELSGEADAPGW